MMDANLHLYNSHIMGRIYAHNFCDWKVRENQMGFSCLALNFFGFNIYFLIKGIRLSVWETKDFNIGVNNLSRINFANIGTQEKLKDTLKFYQKRLA